MFSRIISFPGVFSKTMFSTWNTGRGVRALGVSNALDMRAHSSYKNQLFSARTEWNMYLGYTIIAHLLWPYFVRTIRCGERESLGGRRYIMSINPRVFVARRARRRLLPHEWQFDKILPAAVVRRAAMLLLYNA